MQTCKEFIRAVKWYWRHLFEFNSKRLLSMIPIPQVHDIVSSSERESGQAKVCVSHALNLSCPCQPSQTSPKASRGHVDVFSSWLFRGQSCQSSTRTGRAVGLFAALVTHGTEMRAAWMTTALRLGICKCHVQGGVSCEYLIAFIGDMLPPSKA